MKVIPAIDIRGGKVVRLIQGAVELETVYSEAPLEIAEKWASFGVDLIHVVDLDGAMEGTLKNLDIVKAIVKKIRPKIELGGGIRDEATISEVLDMGVDKVVIGTKALDEKFLDKIKDKFRERIVVAIDARGGIVHTKGWAFVTKVKAIDLAKKVEGLGIKRINYTDISKDGTLQGPNIKSLKELLKATHIEIVASGGISTIEDVRGLKALEKNGLAGVIIGKALYENTIDLKEALKVCSQKESSLV
ncbi:MAG: 1-(5-phosphoribosyl)-5-[(5-phosphoribosylamino)methylideneamino]imidazole-4-carboxamide isomerase [Candidatus Omnitrophica bacterium]|nr:1-(5-phosphoribosyl)-5-[(5-phosphoribosylamino)methylideneamino]imidazole-4-carboxamide isomerase [Candidatus Omnitrophota bacterium]